MDSGTGTGTGPLVLSDSREDQILRLLDTRFDNLPERRSEQPARGFVHGVLAPESCPDCLANDRPMFGCETCGGSGVIEFMRERDPYAESETVQPYGLDGSHHEHARAIAEAILVAERDLSRFPGFRAASEEDELEEANRNPYGWEIARRRMYAEFDYGALDRALEQLHLIRPGSSPRTGFGLAFISGRLPDPLRAPPPPPEPVIVGKLERAAGPQARDVRDNRIRELADQGLKPEAIAKECHVSIRTVYTVVNAERAA